MPPLLLAIGPASHAAHSQGPQLLSLDVNPVAETTNTPRHGVLIAAGAGRTTMRETELEFKLWQ